MNILEKKIENQIQFWSLLGPFIILLSIAVLLFKVSWHWYLPMSALVGIPLCLKWKLKGLFISVTFLLAVLLFSYPSWDIEERYWHVGMGMAMAFSFVILTLSLEEVGGLIGQLQRESQSRLDNFLRLDEQVKGIELDWSNEKEVLKSQINLLSSDLSLVQEDKHNYQKLAQLAKEELILFRSQYEHILDELRQKKQHITQLKEKVEEAEITIQGLINGETEKQLQYMTACLTKYEIEISQLKEQHVIAKQQFSEIEQEKEQIKQELLGVNEQLTRYVYKQAEYEQENKAQKNLLHNNNEHIQMLEREKKLFISTLSKLQQDYEQISLKENEYQQKLSQYIETIHDLQDKVVNRERETQLIKEQKKQLESYIEQQEKAFSKQYDDFMQQSQHDRDEMNRLKEEQIQHLQQNYHHLYQQLNQVQQEKEEHHSQLAKYREELNKQVQEMILIQDREKECQANREHDQSQLNELKIQCYFLEEQKRQLEQAFNELQFEHDTYQKLLDQSNRKAANLPYAVGNTRRIESMYLQLKEQFQEKTEVLDQTRRELFQVQEQLLGMQKDYEEQQHFQINENEWLLQQDLNRLNQELEFVQSEKQEELESLYKLVGDLLKQVGMRR